MIKNKLTLEQSSHQYSLIPISVTRLVNNYLEKEIADSTRNSTHFKKAVHFGNQFHEIAENIINLKKLNKFNIDLFLNELQHQNYDENLLNVTKTFITWIEQGGLDAHNTVAEKKICGIIKSNVAPEVIIAGTFDALDYKRGILYEWKTTSTTAELVAWKLQTRIYCHILNNKIKTVVIYNPKINYYEEFEPKPLTMRELFLLLDCGLYLIDRPNEN